jgi:hypothetical protein
VGGFHKPLLVPEDQGTMFLRNVSKIPHCLLQAPNILQGCEGRDSESVNFYTIYFLGLFLELQNGERKFARNICKIFVWALVNI